eukprot:581326-Pyramimonas_sp.AAC.1
MGGMGPFRVTSRKLRRSLCRVYKRANINIGVVDLEVVQHFLYIQTPRSLHREQCNPVSVII